MRCTSSDFIMDRSGRLKLANWRDLRQADATSAFGSDRSAINGMTVCKSALTSRSQGPTKRSDGSQSKPSPPCQFQSSD
jgi:hypothetical protein